MHRASTTRTWIGKLQTTCLLALLTGGMWASTLTTAESADTIRQYKAAMTRIFLWKYYAFPIFRQNPLFPGQILQIGNEQLYLTGCYSNQIDGNYKGIDEYLDGMLVATSITAQIKGEILAKHIADVEAAGDMRLEQTSVLTVSPLSLDRFEPDTCAMSNWEKTKNVCALIGDLLDGTAGRYFLIAEVLHGKVNFLLRANFATSLSASGRTDAIVKISRLFGINEAGIGVSASGASFTVSSSPDSKTQAIVPARLNFDELVRITYFLQGERGARLEIAVNEALKARDLDIYEETVIMIKDILGEEIQHQNDWAERFVSGEKMVSVDDLKRDFADDINMRAVGNYAAGMILVAGGAS
jgi:hypothetical protein